MSLKKIARKIQNNSYNNDIVKFGSDVRLIWSNAKHYNEKNSDIYKTALKMEAAFEAIYIATLQKMNTKPIGNKIILNTNNNSNVSGLRL